MDSAYPAELRSRCFSQNLLAGVNDLKTYRSEARAIKRADRLRKSFGIWTCIIHDNDTGTWRLGFDPDLFELIST